MSDRAVMPLSDYVSACEKIREKINVTPININKGFFYNGADVINEELGEGSLIKGYDYDVSYNSKGISSASGIYTATDITVNGISTVGVTINLIHPANDDSYSVYIYQSGSKIKIYGEHEHIADSLLSVSISNADGSGLIKSGQLPERIEAVYSVGKNAEWNDFWDVFQKGGKQTNYSNAFRLWTDEIFEPKYDIVPEGTYGADTMFYQSELIDLSGCLNKHGVKLDLSKAQRISATFQASSIEHLPPIDLSSCTSISLGFYNMAVKTLTLVNLRADCTFDKPISYCYNLENLSITGTIGRSGIDLQYSNRLSKASWQNLVGCLSATTTGLSITGSLTSVKKAFETSEGANDGNTSDAWLTLCGKRDNWTISLV